MRLDFRISPCPNDTFSFEALATGRLRPEGFEAGFRFADIEQLNRWALEGEGDVIKVSTAVIPLICDNYAILNAGSALGRGNGPLLVTSESLWERFFGGSSAFGASTPSTPGAIGSTGATFGAATPSMPTGPGSPGLPGATGPAATAPLDLSGCLGSSAKPRSPGSPGLPGATGPAATAPLDLSGYLGSSAKPRSPGATGPAAANPPYAYASSGSATCSSPASFGNGQLPLPVLGPDTKLAVPGMNTTANLLMERLFPQLTDKTPVLFSEIGPRVASGEFDAGVLIHEGRFTYREHGLALLADLGELWEKNTGLPLPLGSIMVKRSLPAAVIEEVERMLALSVRMAMDDPQRTMPFVEKYAQEMDREVMRKHIDLFVNEYTLSLGDTGREAVRRLTGCGDNIFAAI